MARRVNYIVKIGEFHTHTRFGKKKVPNGHVHLKTVSSLKRFLVGLGVSSRPIADPSSKSFFLQMSACKEDDGFGNWKEFQATAHFFKSYVNTNIYL